MFSTRLEKGRVGEKSPTAEERRRDTIHREPCAKPKWETKHPRVWSEVLDNLK